MLLRSILVGAAARGARRRACRGRTPTLAAAEAVLRRGGRRTSASTSRSTAHGFTPFAPVDIFVDDRSLPGDTERRRRCLRRHAHRARSSPRSSRSGQRQFTLRLAEHDSTDELGRRPVARSRGCRSSRRPKRAATGERVRFRGRGFTDADRRRPSTRTTCSRASRARRSSSGCRRATAGRSRSERKQFPFKKQPARRHLDDPVRPGAGLRPEGARSGCR